MRYPWVCLAAAVVGMPGTFAQQPESTFRTSTRLVELSVVALDRKHERVIDLQARDLELFEDGAPRKLAFFRFDGLPSAETSAQPALQILPPDEFTNRPEVNPGSRNITAVVIDALNTAAGDQVRVRASVRKYLAEIPPQSRIGIFQLGYQLTMLHDFTSDGDALREQMKKAPLELPTWTEGNVQRTQQDARQIMEAHSDETDLGEFFNQVMSSEMRLNEVDREDRRLLTLAHLYALARRLQGIPGRKNIVWISSGITSLSIIGSGMHPKGGEGGVTPYGVIIQEAARHIAQSGCALYIVDARGLVTPGADDDPRYGSPQALQGRAPFTMDEMLAKASDATWPAAYWMASITGGRVYNKTNDMAAGLKQAAADTRASYSIAFYAPDEPDGKWHDLKLRVNRPGVNLLYREGYLAVAPAIETGEWTEPRWRSAISNPLGSTTLALDARVRRADAGALALDLRIEPANIFFRRGNGQMSADLDLCVAEITAQGAIAAYRNESADLKLTEEKWRDAQQWGIPYSRRWAPSPSAARLRVIVRDKATNQYGTLDISLAKVLPAR